LGGGGGGGGLEDLEKNFLLHTIEKKYAKESAQKKILLLTLFSIVSTGLQDFAFLSKHICLNEHMGGEQWTTSQGFYRLLEPLTYDSQWCSKPLFYQ
jgi:hypothetical protein